MGGIDMIDVAIGMAFLFSMVALSASTIREMIESSLKSRAIMIETGLRELLSDREGNQIMEDFFQHPQIAALFAGEYRSDALTRPFMSTPYFAGSNRRFLGRLWDRWRKDKMKLRNAVSQARSKEKRLPCSTWRHAARSILVGRDLRIVRRSASARYARALPAYPASRSKGLCSTRSTVQTGRSKVRSALSATLMTVRWIGFRVGTSAKLRKFFSRSGSCSRLASTSIAGGRRDVGKA
jgi:hypothetical protein